MVCDANEFTKNSRLGWQAQPNPMFTLSAGLASPACKRRTCTTPAFSHLTLFPGDPHSPAGIRIRTGPNSCGWPHIPVEYSNG